jgi:hypothetical protein
MDRIDLTLAKLDSALGNTGTSMDTAVWKTPTGSPVSAAVRREARAAARSGDPLGAARLLLVAAADAGAVVPGTLLDEVESGLAGISADAGSDPAGAREAITDALARLRNPAPPAPGRRSLAFWRR